MAKSFLLLIAAVCPSQMLRCNQETYGLQCAYVRGRLCAVAVKNFIDKTHKSFPAKNASRRPKTRSQSIALT